MPLARHKVLYVANAAKIGGGNKVLMDLMLNLDGERYAASLVTPGPGPMLDWARSQGIQCAISPMGDWYGVSGLAAVARRSAQLTGIIRRTGASIVHAAGPMGYRSLGIAGLVTGARRVCHLGFPPEDGELARAFIAGPDVVIGCYKGQATENEALIKRLKPGCQVIGIPNGVDTTSFATAQPAADIQSLRREGRVIVGILGHVSDVKGYGAFVEAAGRLAGSTDSVFVAIGGETTQKGAQAKFETRVRELGIAERFRFLGFRSDVPAVLQAVDIVCLPSLAEGFPLAVLEAMASAKAVVATPVGGVTEAIVSEEHGLLVPPDDPDALTQALRRLMESLELRSRLARAARERVERQFSVGGFAAAVQKVYDSLLAPHSLPSAVPAK
jgi:glycosyltransferase involved in cell wall biosynthesis